MTQLPISEKEEGDRGLHRNLSAIAYKLLAYNDIMQLCLRTMR